MSSDKFESLSDKWNERFDDRDDEDLACHVWARSLARRDAAMAQPFRNFTMDDLPPDPEKARQATGDKPA